MIVERRLKKLIACAWLVQSRQRAFTLVDLDGCGNLLPCIFVA